MALRKVNITNDSISRNVTTDYKKAICEYIWNGFDASATRVDVTFTVNELGGIDTIEVRDNGDGIDRSLLGQTFGCFQDSIKKNSFQWSSQIKGKKGKGRYTFNCFATDAVWESIYSNNDGKKIKHTLSIKAGSNDHYNDGNSEDVQYTDESTGTIVKFLNVELVEEDLVSDEFYDYLKKEFAVFLQLNKSFEKDIYINNERLEFESIIGESEIHEIEFEEDSEKYVFEISFIRWNEKIKENYIAYFLDDEMYERFEKTTSLNKKDTGFHHSVCIVSDYFNNFVPDNGVGMSIDGSRNEKDRIFKRLSRYLKEYLISKQKMFIEEIGANELIEKFKRIGVIRTPKNDYDEIIVNDLVRAVRCIYCVQPKIFINLENSQAKTLVGLLELLLQTDKRGDVITILENIVNLTDDERRTLVEVLQYTELSNVSETIKLLQNRCKTISALKAAVHNKSLGMNEVKDIQSLVGDAFWIFGEEYNIVTEAEPDFEQALNIYIEKLSKEVKGKSKSRANRTKLDHIDKNKEMDVFAFRQNIHSEIIENIVVELKHPNIRLGEVEVSQIKTYMNVITSAPEFNASNMRWKFYLVGNEFDKTEFIPREMESNKHWGKPGLIQHINVKGIDYEIYVKKWSEIFSDFEIRHNFLLKKLELKRRSLASNPTSKEEVHSIVNNCKECKS